MRILYLHQYFNTPRMAGSTRSYEMARRLVHMGHEVQMVSSWREESASTGWFTTDEEGIVVHWIPVGYSNSMSYARRIEAFFRFAIQAARKASSLPADIVFATSTPLTIVLPGAYVARRQNVPMVLEVRDLWPEVPIAVGALRNPIMRYMGRLLERFAYRHAERIVALSPDMQAGIVGRGYPEEKIAVIPNGADPEMFMPDEKRALRVRKEFPEFGEGPVIMYAGTLGKINGVEYFVRLAAEFLREGSNCRFVIIGSGREWDMVTALAEELGVLNESLLMYRPMPKEKLAQVLSAATVTTSLTIDLPELEANSANKFFDGLAAGAPVVINYGGWQEKLLVGTRSGIRLDRDIHRACKQLSTLIGDQELCRRMGENARRLAIERFSFDRLAGSLERVIAGAGASQGIESVNQS